MRSSALSVIATYCPPASPSRVGVVPDEDVPALRAMGVADVILQDTPPDEVVARVRGLAASQPAG